MTRCRILALLFVLAIAIASLKYSVSEGRFGNNNPDPGTDVQTDLSGHTRDRIRTVHNSFHEPTTVARADATKSVKLALSVGLHEYILAKEKVTLRSYNADKKPIGPTIRVKPGDTLEITLKNDIDLAANLFKEALADLEEKDRKDHNMPNNFHWTNLHTHGLSVSPKQPQDDVSLVLKPKEKPLTYKFRIDDKHLPGTHWYHPHRHGSTALQVSSGMAGALIVDPLADEGLDSVPGIKGTKERILVIQDVIYSGIDGQNYIVRQNDVYRQEDREDKNKKYHPHFLINGVYAPTISMEPGEVQRWRTIYAGIQRVLNLCIESDTEKATRVDLHQIAIDGLPTGNMDTRKVIHMVPGGRSDFLVQAPDKPGDYLLLSGEVKPGENNRQNPKVQKPFYLARIKVEDKPIQKMQLPNIMDLKKLEIKGLDEPSVRRVLEFRSDGKKHQFRHAEVKDFNEKAFKNEDDAWESFDPNTVNLQVRFGSTEEWLLQSQQDHHPFHIHVQPFQVVDTTSKQGIGVWRDTVLVTPKEKVQIRIKFDKFSGRTVLHCHNLDHEDQGMMMIVDIEDPNDRGKKTHGFPKVPIPAPDWQLPAASGAVYRLREMKGDKFLFVLVRSIDCSHCAEQLQVLAREWKKLQAAKTKVIAVCPSTPEEIAQACRNDESLRNLPFVLLSDSSLGTFRDYGCLAEIPMHGTFVVDSTGMVVWQSAGKAPFMRLDDILR